ncbi:MAG: S8 family peptidase [Rhizobium sp.]|nr:S8 family peptidase [Rhizobium sp.]
MSTSFRKQRLRALVVATTLAFGAAPAFAGQVETAGLAADQQYDRFIVKLNDATGEKAAVASAIDDVIAAANQAIQGLRLQSGGVVAKSSAPLAASHVRRMSLGADVIATSQKLQTAEAQALMQAIAAHPSVASVQVDLLMQPDFAPNDTHYGLQWGYFDADAGIRADQAWDIANGEGIVVAVLDTGITNHSDLNANIVPGYDMIVDPWVSVDGDGRDADPNDPGDTYTRASSWHGTHVAGTIAAVTNNAKGVSGTAWGARVMPVRVLGRGGGYFSDIADGITWASGGTVPDAPTLEPARVADVINMSLGGTAPCFELMQQAIDGAVSRGTTVVVSAGNDNFDSVNKTPANCANLVNVASITSDSQRSGFSNFGPLVDIAAPGSSIASTLNSGTTVPVAEAYAYYSGTSMAAPHVAGAIALAQSRRLTLNLPLWTPAQAEAQVKATAYAMAVPCPEGCGAGIVDAHALALAAGGGPLKAELGAYLSERPAAITYGREATFGISVRSHGPEVAPGTRLNVAVSNRVASVQPMAPAGWSCSEQEATRTMRNFSCVFEGAYPHDRADTLRFKVRTLRSTTVAMEARVSSEAVDDRPTNNRAAMTFIVGQGSY